MTDRKKKARQVLTYPPSTGRSFAEIPHAIDSLQLTDAHRVATPVNWTDGRPVIIVPALSGAEAREHFPSGCKKAEALSGRRGTTESVAQRNLNRVATSSSAQLLINYRLPARPRVVAPDRRRGQDARRTTRTEATGYGGVAKGMQ